MIARNNYCGCVLALFAGCLLALSNLGYAADGKDKKAAIVNLPLNYFSGEWKTKENASPKISIFFYEQGYQIKIDDKIVTMTGGQLSDVTFPPFFHFQNLIIRGPYGGETYRDLGLVNGVIGTVEVLSGFYSERDHDSEGVIKRGFSTPVILYQQKLGRRD